MPQMSMDYDDPIGKNLFLQYVEVTRGNALMREHQNTAPQNEPNPQRATVQDVPGVKNFLAKDSSENT
ncbi:hypothetical protein PG984_013844 [Apiospora sp. TS-2023a]